MKKKSDRIDSLLAAYEKTSAKRIAAKKRKEAYYDAFYKARETFETETKKKITGVIRPLMKKLLERLSKKGFCTSIDYLKPENFIAEQYAIKGKDETDLSLYFVIKVHEEKNKVIFVRGYSLNEDDADSREYRKSYRLNELSEQVMKNQFIEGLKKICL